MYIYNVLWKECWCSSNGDVNGIDIGSGDGLSVCSAYGRLPKPGLMFFALGGQ